MRYVKLENNDKKISRYKKRKISTILVVVILVMSLGYALLSNSFDITGSSKIANSSWDIHFDNVRVTSGSVSIVPANNDQAAEIDEQDNTKVNFSVTLSKPGDFYEFLVDAVNDGSIDGMIDSIVSMLDDEVITNLPAYLNYSVTYANGDPIEEDHILESNSSETYKVRVEFKKNIANSDLPENDVSLDFDFSVDYIQATNVEDNRVNYQVVHRYEKLDEGYDTDVENLRGEAGSQVTPSVKPREGFNSPNTQEVTISSQGDTVVTYTYTRKTYTFSISDRTYIDNTSTADGTYPYGTEITIKAVQRSGYTFKWSDDSTEYNRVITLSGNLELSTVYTAGDDTPYTVIHKTQNLSGNGYTTREEVTLSGTTGAEVTPEVKNYTGFTAPSTQTVTINGDGSTVVTYNYTRNTYTLTLTDSEYITTSTPSGDYYYETPITLEANTRNNYTFTNWSNNETSNPYTFNLLDNTTIGPVYEKSTYTITYEANGGTVDPTSSDVIKGNSINSFPTPVYQGHYLDGWYTSLNQGIKITPPYTPDNDITLVAIWKVSAASCVVANDNMNISVGSSETINITNSAAIEENYTFASNDTTVATVDSTTGEVTGVSVGNTTITITGSTSGQTKTVNVSIYQTSSVEYRVDFNANGGTVDPTYVNVSMGDSIGTLPEPEREDYIFQGWYTHPTEGTRVTASFTPDSDTEIFARWKTYICKRATTLHTEECTRTSEGCFDAGYTANGSKGTTTITFGNVSTGNFALGNAYDCDLNGDGTYNSTNERFYYIGARGDNAVLMFYSNFEGDQGVQTSNIFSYDTALTKLPTTTQWSNLNVSFDNDKAARFAYVSEVADACGVSIPSSGSGTVGQLDNCVYMFENTRFSSTSTGRSAMWLETYNSKLYRIHTASRNIGVVASSSNNVARPVIEVGINYVDNRVDASSLASITFDTDGAGSLSAISRVKNLPIGELPEVSKPNHVFVGWYADSNFQTEVTSSYVVTGDMLLHAKFEAIQGVAAIGNQGYPTLADAVTAVPNNSATTIRLLSDTNESITIGSTKRVILDLQNRTLSQTSGSSNVIKSSGNLTILNGTITSGATSGAVDNNGGTLTIDSVRIENTDGKQAVYNNGGTCTIQGTSYLYSSSSNRAALHNLASGTLNLVEGTVVSTGAYAVYNESGTLNIGEEDLISDSTNPVIQGETYGVVAYDQYNFYDGIIKGKTASLGKATTNGNTPTVVTDTGETMISDIESDCDYNRDTETIGADTYNTLSLTMLVNKHKIKFDANGGTPEFTSIIIDDGDQIGTLPTVTRGVYTFDGWYTGLSDGIQIDGTERPTANVTYYAHWTYTTSNQPVNFSMTNDVMGVYYNNIATWKNDESTFQSVMQTNFDNYNCKCTDNTCSTAGTVFCDKPKAYDTGLGEELNVYNYNISTQERGSKVNYTKSSAGVIYNMIPGKSYYWELAEIPSIHGIVTASGQRRWLDIDGVRNVRDLGGLPVDSNNDGVVDGTTKYGKLFRGEKLSTSQSSVEELSALGVNEEIDLRNSSERGSSEVAFNNLKQIEIKHYQIDSDHYPSYYTMARNAVTTAMQDVVAGNNIYFHCRIGADRTGTLAYILEGLLQVQDEARLQDYEMTFFFGLINRHRFYSTDPTSSVSKTEKFVYMHNFLTTSQDIIDWYMEGSSDTTADTTLINNFRTAMINSN